MEIISTFFTKVTMVPLSIRFCLGYPMYHFCSQLDIMLTYYIYFAILGCFVL